MPEDYLAFTNSAALVILSFTLLGFLMILIIGIILFHGRDQPVMKDTDGCVIVLFLLALTVSLLSLLISIGAPDNEKCLIIDPLICLCLTFAVSCVFSMSWKLNTDLGKFRPKNLCTSTEKEKTNFNIHESFIMYNTINSVGSDNAV